MPPITFHNYTEDMLAFMRVFFGKALKGNNYLAKGVITGILQIARESLFSGLNNFDVHSCLSRFYAPYFGLLEDEVDQIIKDYQLDCDIDTIRRWYNGYTFGEETNIYNPWSIIKFVRDQGKDLKPYWVNTADTGLINKAIAQGKYTIKQDLEYLLSGESIRKDIKETFILP